MSLTAGTRLGPYEILAPLGAGGMGEVYRARDTKLGREVAIKVLPEKLAQDAAALARFEREAMAVAALSHPNILGIYDLGRDGGATYAAMELLSGETMAKSANSDGKVRLGTQLAPRSEISQPIPPAPSGAGTRLALGPLTVTRKAAPSRSVYEYSIDR